MVCMAFIADSKLLIVFFKDFVGEASFFGVALYAYVSAFFLVVAYNG